MKKDRQRKVQEKLVGIIFILTLFLFLIINVIVPDREKSVQENRMLATKPKFRLSSLISGDYDEKFEAYMDDQFVGRDMWRKLKVAVDRIGGSRLENGVYIGTNGQLLEQIEVADENHLAANIKAIKSFSESQSEDSGSYDACSGCSKCIESFPSGTCEAGKVSDTNVQYGS